MSCDGLDADDVDDFLRLQFLNQEPRKTLEDPSEQEATSSDQLRGSGFDETMFFKTLPKRILAWARANVPMIL